MWNQRYLIHQTSDWYNRSSYFPTKNQSPESLMASKSWSKPTGFGVLPIAMPTPASRTSKPQREISFNGCRKEGEPQNLRTSDFKRRRRNKKTPKLIVECFKMFARIFWKWRCGGNGRDTCKVGIVKWMYLTEIRGFCANCWGAQCFNVPSPPLSSVKLCLYRASFYQI